MLRCARIGGAAPRLHDRTAADRAAFPARLANHGVGALAKVLPGVGPGYPQVVVLFGATGDLSRRKLLPGLFHLVSAGFIPACRIIGVSLDEIDADGFREIARERARAVPPSRKVKEADWAGLRRDAAIMCRWRPAPAR